VVAVTNAVRECALVQQNVGWMLATEFQSMRQVSFDEWRKWSLGTQGVVWLDENEAHNGLQSCG
jgi:hypothetical protein